MMKKLIADFPDQLEQALTIGVEAQLKKTTIQPTNVLVAGMGGSGIGAGIVRNLLKGEIAVPFLVNQNYHLPAFVGKSSLVIVSSFSGNTEESLAMMHEAIARGAEVAAVSSGGKVTEVCKQNGINCIAVPPGAPPRTCLGYSMTEQLFLLHHYGLIKDDFKQALTKGLILLRTEQANMQEEAQAVAKQMQGSIPVIYTDSQWEGVAKRFRQQLNENAKMLCWHHTLPEMNHNELVAWDRAPDNLSVVFMRSNLDYPRTTKRIDLTLEYIQRKIDTVVALNAKGEGHWEQALYLIHMGDWISFYLAELNEVDAVEIDLINRLKSELAKVD